MRERHISPGVQVILEYRLKFSGVDMAAVRARKQRVVDSFRGGTEKHIAGTQGLTLIRGEAVFTGPDSLRVTRHESPALEVQSEQIFLNVGARPTAPPIPGLDQVSFLDYIGLQELETAPEHLLILGGSYIALEFGQMFRRFGSRVTIIERASHLLAREDPDVSDEMAKILREDGIEIFVAAEAKKVAETEGRIQLQIQTPDGAQTLDGSHLLVATGRTPNSDRLKLQEAGVRTDAHGFIAVNERLETNVPGVWALGDVKGGPQFTHISYDDFRILESTLLHGGQRTTADRPVPYVVFTDPQLGTRRPHGDRRRVSKGLTIKVAKLPMTEVARAIETDETRGFMKAIVDAGTGQILGCAILGVDGGEVMAVVEIAMVGKLPYTVLRDGVFAHPTLAESLNNLFLTLDD